MPNIIILNFREYNIEIDIRGDFRTFIEPIKNKLKIKNYTWLKDKKIWVKPFLNLTLIELKQKLKEEYIFIKELSDNIDITLFKQAVLNLNKEYENLEKNIENDIVTLPENLKNVAMEHQLESIRRYNKQNGMLLLGWGLGCLSGDTLVTINIRGSSRTLTIKDLYDKWLNHSYNTDLTNFSHHNYKLEAKIRSFNFLKGVFQQYKIIDVFYSGKKETIKLYFDNDKELICTKNHKIYTERGWIEADNLSFEDNIYSNGIILKCKKCGEEKSTIRLNTKKYFGYCHKCYLESYGNIVGYKEYISRDGYIYIPYLFTKFHPNKNSGKNGMLKHRLVYEAFLNHMTYKEWLNKIIDNNFNENIIFLSKDSIIHHKDSNKLNNDLNNLEYCKSHYEHAKIHNKKISSVTRFPIMIPKKVKLIKKENNGIIDTYDISVNESECFVANNILVHNCGKTFGSLLISESKKSKSIIICPVSLIEQWEEEILKWNLCEEKEIFTLNKKNKFLIDNHKYYIFNYEKFRFLYGKDKLSDNDLKIKNWLRDINTNEFILIHDELYKIKNKKSSLFKAFKVLRNEYKWSGIIGLSGTPQENSLMEFYTILNYIQPNCITWSDMEKNFMYRSPWDIYGGYTFKNFELFNQMASKVMFRVLKEDVKKDIPPISQTYRFIENSRDAHEIKKILLDNVEYGELEIYTLMRVLDSYFKPHEELKYYDLLKDYMIEHTKKLEEVFNVLEEIGTEKILIFTAFSNTMRWLIEKLKEKKYNCIGVDASVKDRNQIKNDFINDKYQIVVATETWSRGIDIPNGCDYLINFDFPLNPSVYIQRINRIYRINSENPKTIINLISDVIEKDIYNLVKGKIKISEMTVEGCSKAEVINALAKKWGMIK